MAIEKQETNFLKLHYGPTSLIDVNPGLHLHNGGTWRGKRIYIEGERRTALSPSDKKFPNIVVLAQKEADNLFPTDQNPRRRMVFDMLLAGMKRMEIKHAIGIPKEQVSAETIQIIKTVEERLLNAIGLKPLASFVKADYRLRHLTDAARRGTLDAVKFIRHWYSSGDEVARYKNNLPGQIRELPTDILIAFDLSKIGKKAIVELPSK